MRGMAAKAGQENGDGDVVLSAFNTYQKQYKELMKGLEVGAVVILLALRALT